LLKKRVPPADIGGLCRTDTRSNGSPPEEDVILAPLFATALAAAAAFDPITAPTTTIPGEAITPVIGQPAPEFDYVSSDYVRMRLRDVLREQGSVLLVFADSDDALCALQAHASELQGAGIHAMALTERADRETRALVSRLDLEFSVLSDPQAFVASQYGMCDAVSGAMRAGWFVIDRSGRVRASGRDAIGEPTWTALASGALAPGEVRAAK
jgi:peroxiredoxin